MKIANATMLAMGLLVAGLSLAPLGSARSIGVCADDVYNTDYSECYGVMDGCGAAGVGHWYSYEGSGSNPPAGESGGWCFLYVTTGSGDLAAVCTETEYHVYDDCVVTLG